jgi:polyhydroxyalkanoate synthase
MPMHVSGKGRKESVADAAPPSEPFKGGAWADSDALVPTAIASRFLDQLVAMQQRAASAQFFERDSYASTALPDILDKTVHAMTARATGGISPSALADAYADWALHLATSPGKQLQLIEKAVKKWLRLSRYAGRCMRDPQDACACIEPLPQDKRFRSDAWRKWPFNLMSQAFLLNQQWWHNATTGVRGVTQQHEHVVEFATRQFLDVFSPSNYLLTNPDVLKRTFEEGGKNLVRGFENFWEDLDQTISNRKPAGADEFQVGKDVAVTPGQVVYRNRLVELIQYEPTTDKVRPEPVLIVPAWIMKYYILDLSPHNSLVKYLTDQGFTVFMISWKNPDQEDRDIAMEDYRKLGVMSSLDVICEITNCQRIHGVGYCLGGTLLAIAAAAMARNDDMRFATLSFLASQVDFTEAGELMLFINESQVAFLEDMMWEQGFLDTRQMAGAFQMLRSNDLVWGRLVREHLLGERTAINDLMAWNADATRMPFKMHSQYLRHLFLHNDLAEGRYLVDGYPVALTDIKAPVFSVGTEWDHVAPWRSVYKLNLLVDTSVTFLLTNGGHNAGIVSEPGHPGRHYRISSKKDGDRYQDPDAWIGANEAKQGSWWLEFSGWLSEHSGEPVNPPTMGASKKGLEALCKAPGTYVLQG